MGWGEKDTIKNTIDKPNLHSFKLKTYPQKQNQCGGWDSNPRKPSLLDLKSSAFDLAGQPPHLRFDVSLYCSESRTEQDTT